VGTSAETANVDYLYSFADQGKQISVFRFPFAENKRKFFPLPFSVCSKQTEVAGKPKPGRFSLVLLLFAHRAFECLSFVRLTTCIQATGSLESRGGGGQEMYRQAASYLLVKVKGKSI
jgi:hypothetical protein